MSPSTLSSETATRHQSNESARRPVPPLKVAFFGIFGVQNLGNECTLQAILYHARQRLSEQNLFAISFDPNDTFRRHGLAAFPVNWQDFSHNRPGYIAKLVRILVRRIPGELRDWSNAVRTLRGTDLMIMTGTGMLTDYMTSALSFPYHVFRWTLAARIAGCKVRFVGIGVGPIYERLSRFLIRQALRVADYRSFRDEFSKKRVSAIFDSSRDCVFPDLAFSLPSSIFPSRRASSHNKLRIGLGIMDFRDIHLFTPAEQEVAYTTYIDKMCDLVEWLTLHDYEVRILQGDSKCDPAPRAELRTRLSRRGVTYEEAGIIDQGSESVEDLLQELAVVDIVVSPRFHNLLLGLMMNIPGISLSYDPKNDKLLEGFGLGYYRQPIFDLSVQLLTRQLIELQECMGQLSSAIAQRVADCRRSLEAQYDLVFSDR